MINSVIIVSLAVFLLIGAAIILMLGLDKELHAERRERKSQKEKIASYKLQKRSKLSNLIERHEKIITESKTPGGVFFIMTILSIFGGFGMGKLFFTDTLLAAAVAVIGTVGPQILLRFRLMKAKSSRMDKIRGSMMILTNSYIVTEDFIKSVESNLDALEYPLPFRDFLTYINYMDSNIKIGLRRMEAQVDNPYFSQWADALVMSQDDRNLKYAAASVVEAMNDVYEVQRESETAMFSIWREYFTLLTLIFSMPLIFRMLMNPAYTILVTSPIGKIMMLLLLAAVVFSVVKAMKLNKPLLM